ncbi:IS66 family insertion sequence element accessory protein TnpA [Virgibacillus dakarensis]|uniref:IS66 family insertion sequence element accessory protein TnpA n=1 Tax=Virgibacillus dakarensis TaxID=1917889 RepID=UPI000B444221|nr:transposase [Virgibacillus dakarensis]
MTQADKRIEWKARFDAWKASGFSVAEWCRKQGVKDHQMYYWIQKFEYDTPKKETSETQWLTVKVDEPINVTTGQEPVFIHFGAISVEVRPGANMAVLSDVVHVLQNQC